MFHKRLVCLLTALSCVLALGCAVSAAEVDCDSTYCFSTEDFAQEDSFMGICITGLPEGETGTVMLGTRILRSGDIIPADQLAQLTFAPIRTEENRDAVVTYLPIYSDHVASAATMTIAIRGKEDKAPVAQDMAVETYKNLPNEAALKVSDPEGQALTYTLVRQPRRGTVELRADGTFVYTPKKNKVGTDSFTFTAADPAGNVSREATVTVQILKPTDAPQYTDTVGQDCRFEAEWLKNTGLFVGEQIGGLSCFYPEKEVSRGEFLTMVVKALDIPTGETVYESVPADAPEWLKPYLAAAIRSGLTENLPEGGYDQAITAEEAALMLQNVLDLTVATDASLEEETPGAVALNAMADNGIQLTAGENLTRGDAAQVLYQVSCLAEDAPGMQVLRMQQ